MTNMTNLIKKMIEKKELEGSYGHASCFDFPKQYDRMEELATEIMNEIKTLEFGEVTGKDFYDSLDSIAGDFMNGNYNEESIDEISYYSQDDFIEIYIVEGFDESARKMFDSLFYFMNSDDRNKYIDANYLTNMPNTYSNRHVDYVIMVHGE